MRGISANNETCAHSRERAAAHARTYQGAVLSHRLHIVRSLSVGRCEADRNETAFAPSRNPFSVGAFDHNPSKQDFSSAAVAVPDMGVLAIFQLFTLKSY